MSNDTDYLKIITALREISAKKREQAQSRSDANLFVGAVGEQPVDLQPPASFTVVNKYGRVIEYGDCVAGLLAQLDAMKKTDCLAGWADHLEEILVINEDQCDVIADVFGGLGARQSVNLYELIEAVRTR